MSVAYNTVAENSDFDIQNKTFESFLFIGSLYKQKKIFILIEAYHQLLKIDENILKLEIVGDGDEFNNIQNYIKEHSLEKNIILHGKITSDKELLPIMQRAVVCISRAKQVYQFKNVFHMVQVLLQPKMLLRVERPFPLLTM
jgi:glycosyltransferase involved in cell wall biosynthesis